MPVKGNDFVDGTIGMNPAQRIQKHVKLTGIIAEDTGCVSQRLQHFLNLV
jgi:hypothetical protein